MSRVIEPGSATARKDAQKLYEKACALTKGELILHENQGRKLPGFWTRLKLKRAVKLLERVLELVPTHWNSMWILGKTVQRLGDERAAFDWFVKACDQKPRDPNAAREAALSAMNLGLARHAIEYCEEALKLEPNEPGLICNLALALIHDGKPVEAVARARLAVDRDPSDTASQNVLRLAQHLVQTNSPCPRNNAEIQDYCRKHRDIFR
jgi:tetratricopeptide (TPR) repeat protein